MPPTSTNPMPLPSPVPKQINPATRSYIQLLKCTGAQLMPICTDYTFFLYADHILFSFSKLCILTYFFTLVYKIFFFSFYPKSTFQIQLNNADDKTFR
jgi:hypothetical protein